MPRKYRKDELGEHRTVLERNKKKIYATQSVCGICGKPVDMSLRYPDPMSKTVDHIIPINRGGHPSDIENLQLAHLTCNLEKADRILKDPAPLQPAVISNRNLPQSFDWKNYKTQAEASSATQRSDQSDKQKR